MVVDRSLTDHDVVQDPWPYYAELREHDPIHWSEHHRAWLITRYRDVADAFRDPRLSSDRVSPLEASMEPVQSEAMQPVFDLLRGWMVFNDPPDHGRLRAPVSRAFTPRSINRLRQAVEVTVADLLDDLDPDGFDLLPDLAFPLPAIVIAELLGVPAEDRDEFKLWSGKLAALVFGGRTVRPDVLEMARSATDEFNTFFGDLIARYEAEPGDNLISVLIAARDEGEFLSPAEMVGACTLLLFGGHETTTGLITSGVVTLLDHPDQLARLRSDPELAAPAVEEMMRYDGPSKFMVRRVGEPFEWEGRSFEAGQRVYLGIGPANHDPDEFTDPEGVDVGRDPNNHLGFGYGPHFCLGASLARVETQIAVTRLVERFPGLRYAVDPDSLSWFGSVLGRGLPTVPLAG